jgi:hypothetical protein
VVPELLTEESLEIEQECKTTGETREKESAWEEDSQ